MTSTRVHNDDGALLTGSSPYLWGLAIAFLLFNIGFLILVGSGNASFAEFAPLFIILGGTSGFGSAGGALSKVTVTQDNVVLTNMFRIVTIDRVAIAGLQSASGFYVILKNGKPIIPTAFTPTLGKRSSRNSRGRKFAQALAEALNVESDIDNPKPQVISKDDVVRKIRWQTPVWMLAGSATSLSLFTVIHLLIGT